MRLNLFTLIAAVICFQYSSLLIAQSPAFAMEIKEIEERRTANSKTFIDPLGQFHYSQTGGVFHFENAEGNWEDIQRKVESLNSNPDAVGIYRTELPIQINSSSGKSEMTLLEDGDGISFGQHTRLEYWDADNQVIHSNERLDLTEKWIGDNDIILKNYFEGIDRVQTLDYWYLQTDYRINEPLDIPVNTKYVVFKDFYSLPAGWKLDYTDGTFAANGWQGSLGILNANGNRVAEVSMPKYYDSIIKQSKDEQGKHADLGVYRINPVEGGYIVSMLVDAAWLSNQDLVYPVIIDPTISNTYGSAQGLQDWITQFNANCQANLQIVLPAGNAINVTNSSIQYTIRSKGYVGSIGWTDYFAAGMEQRSRVGCGTNWTPVQNGYGNSISVQDIPYNIGSSSIANGCYAGGSVLTYKWQGYNTYFPYAGGPAAGNIAGCVPNYQEMLTNTWVVTVTYTELAITASANPSTQTICSGQNAQIQLTGTPNNVSYTWTATNNGTAGASNGSGANINQTLTATSNASASYTITPAFNGCQGPSITATVNVVIPTTTDVNEEFCQGSSFDYEGTNYAQPGDYSIILQSSIGCDSLILLHLTQTPAIETVLNEQICAGSAFSAGGNSYSNTGTYTVLLESINGCDSLVTLNLVVNPVITNTIQAQICAGNSYQFNGNSYNSSGTYTAMLQTINGCDSIVNLNLTVTSVITSSFNAEICQGGSYSYNNNTYTSSGAFPTMYQTAQGCDSVATLNITVNPNFQVYLNHGICPGQSYSFNGNVYSAAGSYQAHLLTTKGCDSIVNLNLSIHPQPTVNIGDEFNQCYGQSVVLRNNGSIGNYLWSNGSAESEIAVSNSGTYWLKVTSAAGCSASDTCVVTTRVVPVAPDSLYFELCGGEIRYLNASNEGAVYLWSTNQTDQTISVTKGGVYEVLITNQFGCSRYESFIVREFCEASIFVPSSFTPNDDGLNDYFKIEGENIGSFEMVIYNRWGQPVFESSDVNHGWNGSFSSGDYYAQNGLYHWSIRYKAILDITGVESDWKGLKGYVTVFR